MKTTVYRIIEPAETMASERFTVTKATDPIGGSVAYGAAGGDTVPTVKIHDSGM